jgi:hypothetical protein
MNLNPSRFIHQDLSIKIYLSRFIYQDLPVRSPAMMMTPKSGLFLAIACVCGVAAVGCVFEISSGQPDLGMNPTIGIFAASIPVGVLSFIAAVKDAKANL